MEALTAVFAILFIAQTAIFITLYRREETRAEKAGVLHESALKLIRERGSVISSDVSRSLGLSREHTDRVMKSLHERSLALKDW